MQPASTPGRTGTDNVSSPRQPFFAFRPSSSAPTSGVDRGLASRMGGVSPRYPHMQGSLGHPLLRSQTAGIDDRQKIQLVDVLSHSEASSTPATRTSSHPSLNSPSTSAHSSSVNPTNAFSSGSGNTSTTGRPNGPVPHTVSAPMRIQPPPQQNTPEFQGNTSSPVAPPRWGGKAFSEQHLDTRTYLEGSPNQRQSAHPPSPSAKHNHITQSFGSAATDSSQTPLSNTGHVSHSPGVPHRFEAEFNRTPYQTSAGQDPHHMQTLHSEEPQSMFDRPHQPHITSTPSVPSTPITGLSASVDDGYRPRFTPNYAKQSMPQVSQQAPTQDRKQYQQTNGGLMTLSSSTTQGVPVSNQSLLSSNDHDPRASGIVPFSPRFKPMHDTHASQSSQHVQSPTSGPVTFVYQLDSRSKQKAFAADAARADIPAPAYEHSRPPQHIIGSSATSALPSSKGTEDTGPHDSVGEQTKAHGIPQVTVGLNHPSLVPTHHEQGRSRNSGDMEDFSVPENIIHPDKLRLGASWREARGEAKGASQTSNGNDTKFKLPVPKVQEITDSQPYISRSPLTHDLQSRPQASNSPPKAFPTNTQTLIEGTLAATTHLESRKDRSSSQEKHPLQYVENSLKSNDTDRGKSESSLSSHSNGSTHDSGTGSGYKAEIARSSYSATQNQNKSHNGDMQRQSLENRKTLASLSNLESKEPGQAGKEPLVFRSSVDVSLLQSQHYQPSGIVTKPSIPQRLITEASFMSQSPVPSPRVSLHIENLSQLVSANGNETSKIHQDFIQLPTNQPTSQQNQHQLASNRGDKQPISSGQGSVEEHKPNRDVAAHDSTMSGDAIAHDQSKPKEHELLGKGRWGRGNLTVQTAADLPASESSQKLVTSSDQGSNSREKSSKAQQRLSIDSPRAIAYKDSLPSRPPSLKIEQVPSSLQPLKEPSPQERGGEVKTTPSEHAELSRIRSASDSDPKSIRHSYDEKFEKPRRDVQYRPQKADAQNGRTDSLNEPVSSAPTVSNKEKSLSPPTPGSVEKRDLPRLTSQSIVVLGVEIGRGSFGIVRKCTIDGSLAAVKLVRNDFSLEAGEALSLLKSEIELLSDVIKHPNIVRYLGHQYLEREYRLYMEYLPFSLRDLIKKQKRNKRQFSGLQLKSFCGAVADAVRYLHNLPIPIAHRDLKASNVLVDVDEKGTINNVKLCDFGVAKSCHPTRLGRITSIVGTPGFIAPEIKAGRARNAVNQQADAYSFGVFMVELITMDLNITEKDHGSIEAALRMTPEPLSALRYLAERCIQPNPDNRPSFNQICDSLARFEPLSS
eukprot:TRINITY_DN6975_c0_g1_i1.p1 TRINITY_DN6975_c0_g1~~TRINITY_DN6975_c0_g1_i1.p1  ORF type:complete len:1300 (+),score=166.46 TRINITY_DN6975_c0_g1_i1:88-3987(+)